MTRETDCLRRRAGIGAAAILAVLLFPPTALAEDDAWSVKWSNGFKVDSPDKKYKLKFGGRIQADATFVSADDALVGQTEGDGFEFRRARLFFEGTIYERIKFKAQYDFAGGDADFKDVYIGVLQDWGELRFGHYKEYFSLEELTSSKYLAFLERSLNNAFSPGRNSGKGLRRMEEAAAEMMEEFLKRLRDAHSDLEELRDAESKLVIGLPITRILEVAEKVEAQLIFVGSQGRTGLPHLLLGSKAERLAQLSPIPVTIVKAEKKSKKG